MKVLVGVTASIAAYKAAEIVSLLVKAGSDVSVVMTRHAAHLIGEATFRALTGNDVRVDLFEPGTRRPTHIEIATEHDVVTIAPATANVIGKLANGICDDLLTTIVLSTTAPVVVAPAMNEAMYLSVPVQENLQRLRQRGYYIVEPETGWLACGKEGKGRLAPPERIVETIMEVAGKTRDLQGKKVVVTGGPTLEPIDAVRFISNRSSGKMAVALAAEASSRGAETVLVTGPITVAYPYGVRAVEVETAHEMKAAILDEWQDAHCLIMAAAVCDFKPKKVFEGKLKRSEGLKLELETTPDIVAQVSAQKGKRIVVGFALETEEEIESGKAKLEDKGLDLVMVNNPLKDGAGFGSDTNRGYLIDRHGRVEKIPLMSKRELARRIMDAVTQEIKSLD